MVPFCPTHAANGTAAARAAAVGIDATALAAVCLPYPPMPGERTQVTVTLAPAAGAGLGSHGARVPQAAVLAKGLTPGTKLPFWDATRLRACGASTSQLVALLTQSLGAAGQNIQSVPTCDVCGTAEDGASGTLQSCADCGVAVHATCYRVDVASTTASSGNAAAGVGRWRCAPCQAGTVLVPGTVVCAVCPRVGGAAWPTDLPAQPWCHAACALALPGLVVVDQVAPVQVGTTQVGGNGSDTCGAAEPIVRVADVEPPPVITVEPALPVAADSDATTAAAAAVVVAAMEPLVQAPPTRLSRLSLSGRIQTSFFAARGPIPSVAAVVGQAVATSSTAAAAAAATATTAAAAAVQVALPVAMDVTPAANSLSTDDTNGQGRLPPLVRHVDVVLQRQYQRQARLQVPSVPAHARAMALAFNDPDDADMAGDDRELHRDLANLQTQAQAHMGSPPSSAVASPMAWASAFHPQAMCAYVQAHPVLGQPTTLAPVAASAAVSSARRSATRARELVAPPRSSHGPRTPSSGSPAQTSSTVTRPPAPTARVSRAQQESTASSRCGETIRRSATRPQHKEEPLSGLSCG